MNIILPIKLPLIRAFCHQALIHAILTTNEETAPWLHSNYIQIFTLKDLISTDRIGTLDFYCNFYGDFHFYEHSTCPWLLMNRYPREVVREKWNGEFNFVKERIKENEYVYLVLDRKYYFIRENSSFHPVLIYGFDDNNNVFYAADNNKFGKYGLQTIDYSSFLKSLNVPPREDVEGGRPEGICTFKLRKTSDPEPYKFHLTKVIRDLKDYIDPIYGDDLVYAYGIMCYDELCKYYNHIKQNEYIDIRAISTMVDHKRLMTSRLEYMSKNGYISDNLIHNYYNQVESRIITVRNLLLKYNISNDEKIIVKSIDILQETASIEKKFIINLIGQLEH